MKSLLWTIVRDVTATIVDVVYPPLCFSCGTVLPQACRIVCPFCAASMRSVVREDPLFTSARERLCADGVVDDLFSLFVFEKGGGVQTLLHQLKYAGATSIGRWMGERIGCAIQRGEFVSGIDAVVPVPLHTAKRRERGYNQSEQIATGICRATGLPPKPGLVRRVHHTQTQTALGFDERKRNMEGAFAVPRRQGGRVEGCGLLLVDDVITTGATIRSCAQVLRSAGARRIVACSVGLADRTP
jgi:ComF family protein